MPVLHYIIYIFQHKDVWTSPTDVKPACREARLMHSFGLINTDWLWGLITLYLLRITLKWFSIFCIIPDSLNTNVGQTRWNPMFPRQADKKCQEEACTFKGQATGKGLWVGFCCVWQLSVRACCLLLSLHFQNTQRRYSGHSVSLKVDTTAAARLETCWDFELMKPLYHCVC